MAQVRYLFAWLGKNWDNNFRCNLYCCQFVLNRATVLDVYQGLAVLRYSSASARINAAADDDDASTNNSRGRNIKCLTIYAKRQWFIFLVNVFSLILSSATRSGWCSPLCRLCDGKAAQRMYLFPRRLHRITVRHPDNIINFIKMWWVVMLSTAVMIIWLPSGDQGDAAS